MILHSVLSYPNLATFQRPARLSAQPLLPNQWRSPVTRKIGAFGYWSMMGFLAVLTIGFIYEWKKGALEWE